MYKGGAAFGPSFWYPARGSRIGAAAVPLPRCMGICAGRQRIGWIERRQARPWRAGRQTSGCLGGFGAGAAGWGLLHGVWVLCGRGDRMAQRPGLGRAERHRRAFAQHEAPFPRGRGRGRGRCGRAPRPRSRCWPRRACRNGRSSSSALGRAAGAGFGAVSGGGVGGCRYGRSLTLQGGLCAPGRDDGYIHHTLLESRMALASGAVLGRRADRLRPAMTMGGRPHLVFR